MPHPQLRDLEHAHRLAKNHGWATVRFDPQRKPPGFSVEPCPNCGTTGAGYPATIEEIDHHIHVRCAGCDDPTGILNAFYTPNGHNPDPGPLGRIRLTSIADTKRRSVSIVPCGLNIPYGTISIVCGTQGLGKSLITCYAAAELTRRGHAAIFIAEEDSVETVIRPRLEAARADLNHCYFPEVETHDDLGGIVLPKDTSELATLARLAGVLLVVIDPWTNHLDVDVDKGAVRGALMPIARAARESGFAVILVAHPTKRTDGNPLSQIAHASAVSQVARSAFMLAADPEHPAQTARENPFRLLTQEKSNLTETAATLRFQIQTITLPADDDQPEVTTAAVTSAGTSMLDWTGIMDLERRKAHTPNEATETGRCQAWLIDYIGEGHFPKPQIVTAGGEAGYSARTIERASKDIIVSTPKPPGPNIWSVRFANGTPSANTLANRANRGEPMEKSHTTSFPREREAISPANDPDGSPTADAIPPIVNPHSSIGSPGSPTSPAADSDLANREPDDQPFAPSGDDIPF